MRSNCLNGYRYSQDLYASLFQLVSCLVLIIIRKWLVKKGPAVVTSEVGRDPDSDVEVIGYSPRKVKFRMVVWYSYLVS